MKYIINTNQRAFLYKNWKLEKILSNWKYNISTFFWEYKLELQHIATTNPIFTWQEKDILLSNHKDFVEEYFYKFEISDDEIWVIYKDNNLKYLLKWGQTYLYWKWFGEYRCEKINIKENPEIDLSKYSWMRQTISTLSSLVSLYTINSYEKWVLEIDWKFEKILESWEYLYSNILSNIQLTKYDTRFQTLDISGQEILTKDKISIRVNISVNFLIKDIEIFHKKYAKWFEYIYQKAQFIVRELSSEKKLDEILEAKNDLSKQLVNLLTESLEWSWLEINFVWIKDIILPWDMREIMNKVIEAEKKSQINMIKRRDETATTRSLLNTAKLLEDNPMLVRLKELETLENVIDKIWSVNLSNGIDGLLKDFVKIGK